MKYFCINCLEYDGNVSVLTKVEDGHLNCKTCDRDVVDNMPCFTQEEMVLSIKFFMQGCPKEDREHWQKKLEEVEKL